MQLNPNQYRYFTQHRLLMNPLICCCMASVYYDAPNLKGLSSSYLKGFILIILKPAIMKFYHNFLKFKISQENAKMNEMSPCL